MKKTKLTDILLAVVWVLQFVAEFLTAVTVLRLNMLPVDLTAALILLLVLIAALTGVLMFWPRGGYARRIVACLIAIVMIVGCGFAASVLADVQKTLEGVTQQPARPTSQMTVYVRADDAAQTLEDAGEYTFAIVDGYDVERTQLAIDQIQNDLGKSITVTSFMTVPEMASALYAQEIDAIILHGAYIPLLQETEGYADFSTRVKVLCEVAIVEPTEPTETPTVNTEPGQVTVPPAPTEPRTITNAPFIVYVSGSDTRDEMLTVSRSDVNILAVVNPETKQVLLVNTPRDYFIPNPAGNGQLDKLTHCGIYGVQNSMEALGDLYGEDVDYYAQINFTGFETMIDAIGGVTVYSEETFTANKKTYIQRGENDLNGEEALDFARERYALDNGDEARGRNQMELIKAVIKKLISGAIITKYADILDSIEGMFVTDITMNEISQLVRMQLSDMSGWNILACSVTGEYGSAVNYSAPGQYLFVVWVDEGMVAHTTDLIDRVMAGEILTEADLRYVPVS